MNIKGRNEFKGSVTGAQIVDAYKKAFGVTWLDRALRLTSFHIADQTYAETDVQAIRRVLREDKSDRMEYVSEYFDCDDFAFALMGAFHKDPETAAMPIFITWVSTVSWAHALLSFYDSGTVRLIEPQTDHIYSIPNYHLKLLCG